jgi:superfamily II DNA or RNA helicase
LFCESTSKADKLSNNVIHSNVTTKAKDSKILNEGTLSDFNNGIIKDVASCLSLTLGLNMVGVNWIIYESYYGSKVNALQRKGRANRLSIDEVANIIILKPKNTQMETWFNKAFDFVTEFETINNVNDLKL